MEEKGMIWYILALVGLIFVYVWVSKIERILFKASLKEDKITFLEGKEVETSIDVDDDYDPFRRDYPVMVRFDLKHFKFRSNEDYNVFVDVKHRIFSLDKDFCYIEFPEGSEAVIKVVDKRTF